MADFIVFDEGVREIEDNGFPATCRFLLSTNKVGTGAGGELLNADTLAGTGVGEITGTGYARQSQAEPAASGRSKSFVQMSWSTGAATDWPAAVRSVVLVTSADNSGKALCAWNLLTGGAARDLSQPSTTEQVTPTFTIPSTY